MIRIDTYSELRAYITAYVYQDINLLFITSRGGLAKTFSTKLALKGQKFEYFSGHVTPLQFYKKCYEAKGKLLILDDVDVILKNNLMVSLLKQLCETERIKTVQYQTSKGNYDVPDKFQTTSRVLVLANDIHARNKDVAAFLTRGIHIHFCPSVEEVYENLKGWAKDGLVLDFVRKILPYLTELDLRKYVHAEELRKSSLDWENYLLEELGVDANVVKEGENDDRRN